MEYVREQMGLVSSMEKSEILNNVVQTARGANAVVLIHRHPEKGIPIE